MTGIKSCFECGGKMRLVRENVEITIGSRTAVVPAERFRCGECGEIIYSPSQMDAAQRAASNSIREREGLLTPSEIRTFRESRSLSQAQLEQLLGVGPKTVVRWEKGTVFQNRATDELLRVIAAVPGAFEYLARKNGLPLFAAHPSVSDEPLPSVSYSVPEERATLKKARVLAFQGFRPEARQETLVRPTREVSLPDIPEEALR